MKTQLALAFLFLTLSAPAQDRAIVQGKLARQADDYLTRCEAFGFSGTVLVESQGQVILEKAYGFADRASGVPNQVDTLFDLGSLTKQFTAAAVLCLEQDKKLKTSDRLGEFFENVPKEMAKIELHHLLNHTSGLPRADNRIGSVLQDREEFLKTIFSCSPHSKPGQSFVYSNIGYDLLAAVVEVVSEQPFEDFCRARLFTPAKMTTTDFRGSGVLDDAKSALGHAEPIVLSLPGSTIQGQTTSPWDKRRATEGWYSWGLRGAGGVISTARDVLLWDRTLFESTKVLNAKSRKKLLKPGKGDYAYGWYVLETDRKTPWIAHGGSTGNGFEVKFGRFPEDELLVIVLGNVSGVVPWVNLHLVELLTGELEEEKAPRSLAQLEPAALSAREGSYESSHGARFLVRAQEGGLVLEAVSPEALSLFAPLPSSWSDEAEDLVERTEQIAVELSEGKFDLLHSHEGTDLFFFDDWWKRLQETHGPLLEQRVIGAVKDPALGEVTLLHLRYENGAEIVKLGWREGRILSTKIGAPYPSMVLLHPASDSEFVAYDLRLSTVTARVAFEGSELKLERSGKTWKLERREEAASER